MPVSYTNRKGFTYTLYRGQTRSGKPRYYFGRAGQSQGEPVTEIQSGFTISESVNGVVSLVKDCPSLIRPDEVAAVEAAVQQHPEARRYRVAVKHDRIEIYEQVGPDYEALLGELLRSFPLWVPISSMNSGELEIELLRYHLKQFDHVSYERVCLQQGTLHQIAVCLLRSLDAEANTAASTIIRTPIPVSVLKSFSAIP